MNKNKIKAIISELKNEVRENRREMKRYAKNEVYCDAAHLYSVNTAIIYIVNRLENVLQERD